jgi:hypothetical protein
VSTAIERYCTDVVSHRGKLGADNPCPANPEDCCVPFSLPSLFSAVPEFVASKGRPRAHPSGHVDPPGTKSTPESCKLFTLCDPTHKFIRVRYLTACCIDRKKKFTPGGIASPEREKRGTEAVKTRSGGTCRTRRECRVAPSLGAFSGGFRFGRDWNGSEAVSFPRATLWQASR